MKITVDHPNDYARNLLHKCGYAAFDDPNTKEVSYVRRLTSDFYPRFHAYAEEKDEKLFINIHLDQKKPSYKGADHMHSGEYEGEIVEREARWLKNQIEILIKERRGDRDDE